MFSHNNSATRRERGGCPAIFENRKKYPGFGKKGPDCVHFWVNFFIQNVVLREIFVLGEKNPPPPTKT